MRGSRVIGIAAVLLPGAAALGASLTAIAPLGTDTSSDAYAIAPDGRYVVGLSGTAQGFIWDAVNGPRAIIDTGNAQATKASGIGYTVNDGVQQIHVLAMSAGYPTVFHSVDQTATWTKWRDTTYSSHDIATVNMLCGGIGPNADKYYFGINKKNNLAVYNGTGVGTGLPSVVSSGSPRKISIHGVGGTGGGINGRAAGFRSDADGNRQCGIIQNGLQTLYVGLDGNSYKGQTWGVSQDGTVWCGFGPSSSDPANQPYVYFPGLGDPAKPLPLFPDATHSVTKGWAYHVSPDNNYIVGMQYRELSPGSYAERAVLWMSNGPDPGSWNVMDLTDYFAGAGALSPFERLGRAYSVAVDSQGNVWICGRGYLAGGGQRGFVAMLTNEEAPSVPSVVPPSVRRPVYETDATVTVEDIRWDSTEVSLYKNGMLVVSQAVSPGTSSVVFAVDPHAVGDYYTATQTGPGGTSGQSGRRACVLPTVIDLTHLDPGFEGAAFDECWHVAGGSPELATAPDPSHGQSMKERGTSEGGVMGQIWADITPLTPTRYEPIVYSFWMYHTAGNPTEEHFGRLLDFSGSAYGHGMTEFAFRIGVMPHTNNGVYQGQHGSYRFNLDEDGDGQPARSTGWHRMAIKIWRTDEFATTGKVYWYVDGEYGNDGDQAFDLSNTIDSIDLGNKNTATSDGLSAYYDDVSVVQASNQSPYMVLTPINATEGEAIVPTDQLGEDDDEVDSVVLTVLNPEAMPAGLTLSATSVRGKPAVITVSGTPAAGTSTGGDGSGTYMIDLRATDDLGAESLDTLFIKVAPPSGCAEVPQDVDKDGDVDVNDFAVFQACFNGPGMPWPPPPVPQDKCGCLDQDDDGDVDVNDFAVFQTCFNGASNPPGC